MTITKAVPKGLSSKEHECESGQNKQPIPCISMKDMLQEAAETNASMIMLMTSQKIELRV